MERPLEVTRGLLLENTWRTETRIGGGAFGEIWLGENRSTGEKVAIKFESTAIKMPQLVIEYNLYMRLRGGVHVPQVYSGNHYQNKWYYIVMECMGSSLEKLFNQANHHFSKKTCLQLMIQMLYAIEELHNAGIIHRDIKPDNFMFGRKDRGRDKVLCIIDLGLAKPYLDENNRHIPEQRAALALGTARYMPLSAHNFVAQSRRDDLEAIGFVCIYFLNGALPWQAIDTDNKIERNLKIADMKAKMDVNELCRGHPPEFSEYFRRVRSLMFAQRPDYKGLRHMFTALAARRNIKLDYVYDWETAASPQQVKQLSRAKDTSRMK